MTDVIKKSALEKTLYTICKSTCLEKMLQRLNYTAAGPQSLIKSDSVISLL